GGRPLRLLVGWLTQGSHLLDRRMAPPQLSFPGRICWPSCGKNWYLRLFDGTALCSGLANVATSPPRIAAHLRLEASTASSFRRPGARRSLKSYSWTRHEAG